MRFIKGLVSWNKNISCTPECKAKISASEKGKIVSLEARTKMSIAGKARYILHPEERVKVSLRFKGKRSGHWMGGPSLEKQREHIAKERAKRSGLGFVCLNIPFVKSAGHHVDNEQVIFIPDVLHRSIWHRQTDKVSMAKINAVAYNFLFKQEVEAALGRSNDTSLSSTKSV
jgi:hypothetical protein